MKTIAVMQTYVLLYIDYFQLMSTVDKFVVFDDVSCINCDWVNRLWLNGAPYTFTMPLRCAGQNKLTCIVELADEQGWAKKNVALNPATHHAHFYGFFKPLNLINLNGSI